MPRKKKSYADDPTHAPLSRDQQAYPAVGTVGPPVVAETAAARLKWAMDALASRSDGWLRFSPHLEECELYIKWKFTSGPFAGYYCFVSGDPYQYIALLQVLVRHIEEVYEGTRRATLDRPYTG